jgi:hypothetical protein
MSALRQCPARRAYGSNMTPCSGGGLVALIRCMTASAQSGRSLKSRCPLRCGTKADLRKNGKISSAAMGDILSSRYARFSSWSLRPQRKSDGHYRRASFEDRCGDNRNGSFDEPTVVPDRSYRRRGSFHGAHRIRAPTNTAATPRENERPVSLLNRSVP